MLAEPAAEALHNAADAHRLVHVKTHEQDIVCFELLDRVPAMDPEKHLEPGACCRLADQLAVGSIFGCTVGCIVDCADSFFVGNDTRF